MPTIVIEGPEKAGKTTFINILKAFLNADVRKWTGRADPDESIYAQALREDSKQDGWVIWDRGWISESIYGTMLQQDRRLSADSWLGEWTLTRAIQSTGLGLVLLGPSGEEIADLRTEDDLPCNPIAERSHFQTYAKAWGWWRVENQHTEEYAIKLASKVAFFANQKQRRVYPPLHQYAGKMAAPVVFITHETFGLKDQWLPFSDFLGTIFGSKLGWDGLEAGWATLEAIEFFTENQLLVPVTRQAKKKLSGMKNVRLPESNGELHKDVALALYDALHCTYRAGENFGKGILEWK